MPMCVLLMGGLEQALAGARPEEAAERVDARHFDGLAPIDDVRGSAAYRREAAREIVMRALGEVLGVHLKCGEAA